MLHEALAIVPKGGLTEFVVVIMTLNKTQIAQIYALSRNAITAWCIAGVLTLPDGPGSQPASISIE